MNWVDVLILVALALSVLEGWRAGFVATMYGLVTWVLALVVALLAHPLLTGPIAALLGIPEALARGIAFATLFLVVEGVVALGGRLLLAPLLRLVRTRRATTLLDRAAGTVPAVLRTLLLVAFLLWALVVFPVSAELRRAVDGSRIGSALVAEIAVFQPQLERLLGGEQGGLLFITKLSADERQGLDLPEDLALSADPEAERQLFELTNQERVARGLRPLASDARLVPVARAHAEEMFRLRYFGHVSPVTGTPFDRLGKAGIAYRRAGENLAYAQSVAVAHRGLMESEGHRENILRAEFTHVGIGVISAGLYGRMFVEMFLTPPQ